MLTKLEIKEIFKNIGLKNTDTIMIHSGLRAIGEIEGNAEGLIEALKEYFNEGLVILPTHTWAYMKEDNMVFHKNQTPSCVGALTNVAMKTPGFIRSMHPTHSVCAYGKDAKAYTDLDRYATTPVGPNNCFGELKNRNAKILFLGAPLSKNTFIHSIEEEFDVPDRFTDFIYHFSSKDQEITLHYEMPRHFSTKSAHISEHYEKLLPRLLERGIATEFQFGNAICYSLDAKKTHEYVSTLLADNIHVFDDFTPIKS